MTFESLQEMHAFVDDMAILCDKHNMGHGCIVKCNLTEDQS